MQPVEPLSLHHSWPMTDQWSRFDMGANFAAAPLAEAPVAAGSASWWRCELATGALQWGDAVYDLFGLQRGVRVSRRQALALYRDESRAAMERLRAHAIRHRRGFTIDLELCPATGGTRWMRLIAAPECEHGHVVGLHGVKYDVSGLYRPRQVA